MGELHSDAALGEPLNGKIIFLWKIIFHRQNCIDRVKIKLDAPARPIDVGDSFILEQQPVFRQSNVDRADE